MKCLKCNSKAVLRIKRHKAAFCSTHLVDHLQNQVVKAIKKYKMFPTDEKILVAVSGGKDSLALWDILLEQGYKADAFYLNLGIEEYSNKSEQKITNYIEQINNNKKRKGQLYVISLPKILNINIKKISRNNPRSACSSCGLIKRYIMNFLAKTGNYYAVATGHNLDDETSALLGNTLHWQIGYLSKQSPNMPPHNGLARKVKPLFRLSERETAAYCFTKHIDYILEECPMAEGASSFKYKEVLNNLELKSPGTKDQFYLGYLRKGKAYFENEKSKPELVSCPNCGEPTAVKGKDCSFCRQMKSNKLDPLQVIKYIKQLTKNH